MKIDNDHPPRVLVYDQADAHCLDCLAEAAQVDVLPNLNETDFMQRIGDYDALIAGPPRRLTGRMIERGYRLTAIGYAASRLDNVDVSAAYAMGIEVVNAPASSAVAISEQTLSQLLLLVNKVGNGRLDGKTLGLIGFGRIGRQVAQRASAFNMRVLANQPRLTPDLALAAGVKAVDLMELLRESDFVSLHLPFNAETKTILGRDEIAAMKPTACLINTGHADLLDNAGLLEALEHGRLAGATRFTSFKRLGFEHMVFQVVDAGQSGPESFTLDTWYHAISSDQPFAVLLTHLQQLDGIQFQKLPPGDIQTVFQDEAALCYFLDRNGRITLAKAAPGAVHLEVMNNLVASYTDWDSVERTLLTDLPRLTEQFPQLTAVAIFPQFAPKTVFDVASKGGFVPAGLTRFVIPGRILRLNMKLDRLKENDTLAAKRAWFKKYLADRLASSRLRYYQEPVVLLDD
ncbi:MAG: hypothetical protein GWP17_00650 [Aquificales bacterium]|nr:hypothetical protein [Aquificales bacterium]